LTQNGGQVVYKGNFQNGFKHGKGHQWDSTNQIEYEGNFERNKIEGRGKLKDYKQ